MNLRQVRLKIKSIGNVRKITKAMQMVAAVKMKKAQEKAMQGMLYKQYLKQMISEISASVDKTSSKLFQTNKETKANIYIFIATNKGLCGSFNLNLFKYFLKTTTTKTDDKFITFGRKAKEFVTNLNGEIILDFSDSSFIASVSAVYNSILTKFLNKEISSVFLVYNRFVSAFKSEPTVEQLLPITQLQDQEYKQIKKPYIIEPSAKSFLDSLLHSYLEDRIRTAIIESEAGEYSARMMAMKNATDNAGELIYHLTLLRNKLRQEKITYELLDMITAKESVEVTN
ncbi:MAG: ATP synthase gamma chain [Patescibacteria group bacterium]|nr:MAG: ATP synthase gamma chain [Patescibacteria group bacterium]